MDRTEEILVRLSGELGLQNQQELADLLGVSKTTLSSWKSRGTIPIKNLMEVAQSKNISLDFLLLGRNESVPITINMDIYGEVLEVLQHDYLTKHSTRGRNGYAKMAATIYNQICDQNDKAKRTEIIRTTICILNLKTLEERAEDFLDAEKTAPDKASKSNMEKALGKTRALISSYQKELEAINLARIQKR